MATASEKAFNGLALVRERGRKLYLDTSSGSAHNPPNSQWKIFLVKMLRNRGAERVPKRSKAGRRINADRPSVSKQGLNSNLLFDRPAARFIDGRPWLYPANEAYEPIEVTEDTDFEIWGRVTFAITTLVH